MVLREWILISSLFWIHIPLRIQPIKVGFFGTSLWQNPPTILIWIIVYFPNENLLFQFKRRFGEREVTWTIVRFLYQVCITMKILVNYSVSWTLIEVVFLVWYFPTIHNKKMTYSFTRNSSPKKANFRLLFDLVSMGTRLISHSTIGLGFFS